MKRQPHKCANCGRLVRRRLSDLRIVWHRAKSGTRKWCPASPRYKAKQPRAVVVDA